MPNPIREPHRELDFYSYFCLNIIQIITATKKIKKIENKMWFFFIFCRLPSISTRTEMTTMMLPTTKSTQNVPLEWAHCVRVQEGENWSRGSHMSNPFAYWYDICTQHTTTKNKSEQQQKETEKGREGERGREGEKGNWQNLKRLCQRFLFYILLYTITELESVPALDWETSSCFLAFIIKKR